MKTKPWNLEECKADPEHKCIVQFSDGVQLEGRVICFDAKRNLSIVVLSRRRDNEELLSFGADGLSYGIRLLLPVKEYGGWFNHCEDDYIIGPYKTEADAMGEAAYNRSVKQIYHTWEE